MTSELGAQAGLAGVEGLEACGANTAPARRASVKASKSIGPIVTV